MSLRKALGPRRRVAFGLLALGACLVGPWLWTWWRDPWPARAVLRTPGDTWPLGFSPDGRTFATSGGDGITLWDATTGQKRTTWPIEEGYNAGTGAFSPDGRTFAAARFSHPRPFSIELIDVATGLSKASIPTQYQGIYQLAFTDDGRGVRAFLGNNPKLAEVATWQAETGQPLSNRPLTCPTSGRAVTISPDGRWIASAPFRGTTISIWDVKADRELASLNNPASTVAFGHGLAFSEDGRTLAAGRADGSFDLWDVPARRLASTIPGHTRDHESSWIRLAPDGRTLAASGERHRASTLIDAMQLQIWHALFGRTRMYPSEVIVIDIGTGRRLARADSAIHPDFSPDGSTIATREQDFSVRLRSIPGR